jgi:OOP family OmpA-OmpF porin
MKLAFITLALLTAIPAFAQNMYVTGQLGSAEQEVSVSSVSIKDNDTAAAIALGYRITPMLAVEAGYAHLGEFTKSDSGYTIYAKPKTVYGALVGSFTATPAISLHAKVGVARTESTIGYKYPNESGSTDVSKTHAVIGVGASYAFTPSLAAVVEYTYFGKVADNKGFDESLKASMVSAGVRFTF